MHLIKNKWILASLAVIWGLGILLFLFLVNKTNGIDFSILNLKTMKMAQAHKEFNFIGQGKYRVTIDYRYRWPFKKVIKIKSDECV
ncbi:MAG: hypothetical protein WCG27_08970, partial [Pseudomonadota bacterium]